MSRPSLRRNREFTLLWAGQTLSSLGSQVSTVAYPLLVLAVTGSPAKAGVVGFAVNAPLAALSLPAGELADRVDRRLLLAAVAAIRALALTSIPIALLLGRLPYGLIVAVAFLDGTGFIVSYVAERGALRRLVAPEDLSQAVALNEARIFGALVAGPPVGGALFGLGRAVPFLVDSVSYVALLGSLAGIRTKLQEDRTGVASGDVREGLRWLWRRPFFRGVSLLFAASNPLFGSLTLLIVVLAKSHGASSALAGVALGIAAAGGLIGALAAPWLQRRVPARAALVGENLMLAIALPCLLVVHAPVLIGVIVAASLSIVPVTNSIVVALRVGLAPDRLQGRVQAASTLLSMSAGWVGPLLVGFLLQSAGHTATLLVLTGWAAALAAAAAAARPFRHPPSA